MSFLQVTGVGNMAAKPEQRIANSGVEVATFTVCCDIGWGDNKKTEFVRCVAFGKLAGVINQYGDKGMKCLIQGEMQTDSYDKEGVKTYSTKIVVNTFKMLGSKGDNNGGGGNNEPWPEPENGTGEMPF